MQKLLSEFMGRPIISAYSMPTQGFIKKIKAQADPTEISKGPGISIDNRYYDTGIEGSAERVYLRAFLINMLHEALKNLTPDYGFIIYDGYRTKETQAGLFKSYFDQIKTRYPEKSDEEIHIETRKFVSHPDEQSRFEILPHNSGGAVDIGLSFLGKSTNMGTDFDDLTEKASTNYFERDYEPQSQISPKEWETIRTNRRILFHALCSVGFTNWKHEWWHFDIGNCVWAQELKVPWIYDSMDVAFRRKS